MDKDLLYRFFEGRASVEEMRFVKEWSEASEENSKLLRRERKLFNAIILSGRLESSDGQTTLRKKRTISSESSEDSFCCRDNGRHNGCIVFNRRR